MKLHPSHFKTDQCAYRAVQATVKEPVIRNMYKGVSMAYTVILFTYLAVAITGYWAFGFAVSPFVVYSFLGPDYGRTIAHILAIAQIVGCYQVSSSSSGIGSSSTQQQATCNMQQTSLSWSSHISCSMLLVVLSKLTWTKIAE